MTRTMTMTLAALVLVAGCGGVGGGGVSGGLTGDRVVVDGVGPDDLLKLRGGPGLEFRVLLGLPDGTPLVRRDCVTELGQTWCRVSLAEATGVTGYVAADYLMQR